MTVDGGALEDGTGTVEDQVGDEVRGAVYVTVEALGVGEI